MAGLDSTELFGSEVETVYFRAANATEKAAAHLQIDAGEMFAVVDLACRPDEIIAWAVGPLHANAIVSALRYS